MREQWYVDLDREYVSERFAAARRRIDNLKLDWLDIEAMYTSSAAVFYTDEKLKELSGWSEEDIRILFADPRFPSADYGRRPVVEVHSLILFFAKILSDAMIQKAASPDQLYPLLYKTSAAAEIAICQLHFYGTKTPTWPGENV